MSQDTVRRNDCLYQCQGEDIPTEDSIDADDRARQHMTYRSDSCSIQFDPDDDHIIILYQGYSTACGHEECKRIVNNGKPMKLIIRDYEIVLKKSNGKEMYISNYYNESGGDSLKQRKLWYDAICSHMNKNGDISTEYFMYLDKESFYARDAIISVD